MTEQKKDDLPSIQSEQSPVCNKCECPPIKNVTHPLRYYEFTQEELKALDECDRESFYRRCLPISTTLAALTYTAIKRGKLRPNARFGVFPKVTLAVIVGYFIGKVSYQEACAEKLMKLPGSYIGQLLREQREGHARSNSSRLNRGNAQTPPTMFGAGPNDIYSDAGPGSSLDLDTERPIFSGDDSYRPADQDRIAIPTAVPRSNGDLSYDELRRKNRGQYADSKQDPYKMDPNTVPPINRAPPPPPPSKKSSTNKYGDVID